MFKHARVLLAGVAGFLLGYMISQHLPALHAGEATTPTGSTGLWAFDLAVRPVGVNDIADPRTKKFGVEVRRDNNNGATIYITETGSIAVLPPK